MEKKKFLHLRVEEKTWRNFCVVAAAQSITKTEALDRALKEFAARFGNVEVK